MRGPLLLIIGLFLVGCGKNGTTHHSNSQQQQENVCNVNGAPVACETINDGLPVDLLDTMVDVPITHDDSSITFMADKNVAAQGSKISCSTKVRSGETYRYSLNGDTLELLTSQGSYKMKRADGGTDLMGNWSWKGYLDNGVYIIREIYISDNRAILKTHCEF